MKNASLTPRAHLIEVGSTAPDFTLGTQDRADWKLSEHLRRGDVVLSFVPFAFTGTCSTEMKCISDDVASWTKKSAAVVGISCDSAFANKAWAEKEHYTHTLLSDTFRDVCKAYGLYWADLNVANRGTVVIGGSESGIGSVKFAQSRPPSQAMDWKTLLAAL